MLVKESHVLSNIEPLLSILSQPEIQYSLVTALEKVPNCWNSTLALKEM